MRILLAALLIVTCLLIILASGSPSDRSRETAPALGLIGAGCAIGLGLMERRA